VANIKRIDKELAKREEAKKARKKAYDEETGNIDRQIKLLEAQGKSTEALEQLQLKRSLTNQRELIKEARLNLDILRATNIGGINDEIIQETLKSIGEMKQGILNTENDIKIARINNAKETNEDRLKEEQDYNNKLREFQDAIEAERQAKITDAKEKELQDLDNKYEQLYAKADAAGQSDKELIKKQQAEITAINDKYAKIQADALLKAKAEAKKLELQQEQEFQAKIEEIDEANFQAGLQKTMTEEEYQLELVRQKYFTLEELAKGNAEQLAIIETAKALEIGAITKTASDKELADAKAVAEQKATIQQQGLDVALQGIGVIKSVFEKSKGVQKAAVIAESAIGIAKMIISNKVANAGALASPANILVPGSAAPIIALNNISTGFGIAANVAATAKALSALGGGGAPSGSLGGDGGGGGGGGFNPSFNVVGNSGINQLAGLQQQPVKAYITTGEVSTALSLERNTLQKTTF
jgi:hypothetical protein